ncbi:MAG TPA: FdhF/YdeP family oxidoreductase [Candidatus Marinimicrobia bacterium]|nr:FdhF/YdeP family oxidoreductase [Candidatus Neomarinimicrobiota bacterium]
MSKAVSGFSSIKDSLQIARTVGFRNFFRSISSKNTCKTCALGMGGQKGGMTNEVGKFPEICKKSIQAQLTDIQQAIPRDLFRKNTIKDLQAMRPRDLVRSGRLNTPLFCANNSDRYVPIEWDEALKKVTKSLSNVSPDRTFFYSSGRSSNEAAFLLQLFVRAYGTNNINNCSYYCHQASGVGLNGTIGSGTATIILEDLKKSDMIWVIGANPSSNHPRLMTELLHCRRRGGQVIIVNPLREPGLVRFRVPSDWKSMLLDESDIASTYVQPNIGGDIALLKGISKILVEQKRLDIDFISKHTNGFNEFEEDVNNTLWEDIEKSSGVVRSEIEQLADLYYTADNVVFTWSMGITQHLHGVENVESIVNLALLRGMVGRKEAGLLPLRGHSNVQGLGSMGVTPTLKKQILLNIEELLGIKYPQEQGMDTLSCLRASERGEIDFALLMGGNLYAATPDSNFAESALSNIPFKVFITTTLNESHLFGIKGDTVILPVAARDEENQATTQESMFNFVRMSDGGPLRLDNVRSEVSIISDIASEILGNDKVDFSAFKEHHYIRNAISKVIPGFEKMENIDRTKEEFQIENRTYHQPEFATPDQKANFTSVKIPKLKADRGQFRMSSVRSEGQFNTIVYEEADSFRNVNERWVVMMNEKDMQELNIIGNDKVNLENGTGLMSEVIVKCINISPGNVATFFPESNVLIPAIADERSKTPSFKSSFVTITPIRN